jgi:hypothetical protein
VFSNACSAEQRDFGTVVRGYKGISKAGSLGTSLVKAGILVLTDDQAEASATLEAQGFGMALQRIDEAVREAKYNATNTVYGRPNAWRSVLSLVPTCTDV